MAAGNTGKKSLKKQTPKKKSGASQEKSFRNEIILWILLAVCIILFFSNFGLGGNAGNHLSAFFFGLFGFMAYIFPVCFFVGTVFVLSNRENRIATVKVVAAVLFIVFLCLFGQLVTDTAKSQTAFEAFHSSMDTKGGGGFIGGALERLLYPNFGAVGTYVIDIIVLIISLVLITERSALRGLQKGGKVIYDSAKDNRRRREAYASQKKERERAAEQKRVDKKVSGVALDTKLAPHSDSSKIPLDSDKIGEIKIEDIPEIPTVESEEHIKLTSGCAQSETDSAKIAEASNPDTETNFHTLFDGPKEEDLPGEGKDSVCEDEPVRTKKRPAKQTKEEIEADISKIEEAAEQAVQKSEGADSYEFPPIRLLKSGDRNAVGDSKGYLQETAMKLQQTLKNFNVNVTITNVSCGPAVTRYEIQPEMGVKVSKIVGLSDDIKLNLAAADIRIEAPIPGKAAIGIEVPNKESVPVMFRGLVESKEFQNHPSPIAFAAGKDIAGNVVVTDIAKMPHLLIAGATGSGKSVCINTIIMSILYKAHPDDVKLIMIDPKVVELSVYNGIPHLFIPVVTDPKKAAGALHWAVSEMTDRYNKFAEYGVRDLKGYNQKVEAVTAQEDPTKPQKMPDRKSVV